MIHVAGTKGKGSVCAFVSSILSRHQRARGLPRKVGLLTSPHLIAVRERIRLDGEPLSEALFARYFFEVFEALSASTADPDGAAPGSKPIYARYVTLLAFHVFLREGVDAAVVETGVGGEYDATNVVARPLVTGVSTLGIDHIFVLGDTVDKIAWHKAGIIKPGCPALAIEQVAFPSAERVLRDRAAERGVALRIVGEDPRLRAGAGVRVRPDAAFQRRNASLAIALAETALEKIDPEGFRREEQEDDGSDAGRQPPRPLPPAFREGLEQVVWRGRCEVKEEDRVRWHIDGAHTTDSLRVAARWYAGESAGRRGPRVLIFNQQGRAEAIDFLDGLHAGAAREDGTSFDHVMFCTNVTHAATGYKRGGSNLHHRFVTVPRTDRLLTSFVLHRFCQPPVRSGGHQEAHGAAAVRGALVCAGSQGTSHGGAQHRGDDQPDTGAHEVAGGGREGAGFHNGQPPSGRRCLGYLGRS